jgi:predicted amidohydrolase YtcJ
MDRASEENKPGSGSIQGLCITANERERMRRLLVWVMLAALVGVRALAQAPLSADLVLTHGRIWTEDPAKPEAEAVAILGERIVRVGSAAEIATLIGPGTQVVDLKARRVLPGFNDAHVHLVLAGIGLSQVQLRDCKSQAEMRERVANFTGTLGQDEWLLGGNWDHENWTPAELPTHALIDAATAGHPALLRRFDGHIALANAAALRLAGIDRKTPDPAGGVIVRDAAGDPTGIVKDAAMSMVTRVIPAPSDRQMDTGLTAALDYAHRNGVTSVQDMAGPAAPTDAPARLRAYERALHKGTLTLRVTTAARLAEWKDLAGVGIESGLGGDVLRVGMVKAFADGAIGPNTAWLFAPYDDAPGNSGLASEQLANQAQMLADLKGADAAGLQIATHAIGDRAVHAMLELYAQIAATDPPWDRRLRLEHATMIGPADIAECARLHVVVSTQPMYVSDLGRFVERRLGTARTATVLPFRSLLDAGVVLAFGSDWSVEPMKPLLGIYAAVTRRTADGAHPNGLRPEQKISVAEAVHAYTVGAAYAEGQERAKGSIEPGKLADFVVLSEDIFHIDPVEIEKTQVELTVFDGKVVYTREAVR